MAFVGREDLPAQDHERSRAAEKDLLERGQQAQPKSTSTKPLYENFGQKKPPGNVSGLQNVFPISLHLLPTGRVTSFQASAISP